ncbi:MAG: hypothetical protein HQL31_01680 [Planctomycetes bacterium]|nr:hypothetical protein [Planctomycetota bacterium]
MSSIRDLAMGIGKYRPLLLVVVGLSMLLPLSGFWVAASLAFWCLLFLDLGLVGRKLSLMALLLCSLLPFGISPGILEPVPGAGWLYSLAAVSPLYLLARTGSDPWVSPCLYGDTPFHYAFEASWTPLPGLLCSAIAALRLPRIRRHG